VSAVVARRFLRGSDSRKITITRADISRTIPDGMVEELLTLADMFKYIAQNIQDQVIRVTSQNIYLLPRKQ
jgi:hypothetical protein